MNLANVTFVMLLLLTKCNAKSYRDYSLVHGIPKSEHELDFFKALDTFYNVTFWRKPSLVDKPVEFSLSRLNFAELIRDTRDMDIEFVTLIRDLQSAFNNQTIKPYIRRRMESFDWKNYYSVEDIYNWLRDLSDAHPREVRIQSIGQSIQNRHILAVKIELGASGQTNRPVVMVEGGSHAREWISPAFVTFMINTILNSKNSTNQELKQIANSYKWIFIPLLNPDGYAYSQTDDRLWRKNCRGKYGVDLNRNFGVAFGKFCPSKENKQDEEYCGEAPFSEPETSALATFISDHSDSVEYYISFHSYGQYIIIPYTFAKEHMDNYDTVKEYADQIAKRSLQKYNIHYSVGTAYDTVGYVASGTSGDWVKKTKNVSYTLTIELPDQGYYGFTLPKEKILPTCEATMDALLPFLDRKNDTKLRIHLFNGANRHKNFKTVFFIAHNCIILIGLRI